ncbi:cyd operon protein YbgE, partial [gut metagenome]
TLTALAVMGLVVLYPRAIAEDGASVPHGSFVLLMMGMSVCYIVGFGFVPKNKLLRSLFSAPVGWFLTALGLYLVFGR